MFRFRNSQFLLIHIVTAAEEDSDDMFKPPKMDDYDDDDDDDDEFSPFGGKSGLFSGGRGLFDDDDEVTELFSLLSVIQLISTVQRFEFCCVALHRSG